MKLNALTVITMLSDIAQEAQTSGLVPGGTPALVLTALTLGLKATINSGALTPSTPIEINDIGQDFDAAVERMRLVLGKG